MNSLCFPEQEKESITFDTMALSLQSGGTVSTAGSGDLEACKSWLLPPPPSSPQHRETSLENATSRRDVEFAERTISEKKVE
jgi:hypothetical protein